MLAATKKQARKPQARTNWKLLKKHVDIVSLEAWSGKEGRQLEVHQSQLLICYASMPPPVAKGQNPFSSRHRVPGVMMGGRR